MIPTTIMSVIYILRLRTALGCSAFPTRIFSGNTISQEIKLLLLLLLLLLRCVLAPNLVFNDVDLFRNPFTLLKQILN
jgi:hypothetical protein